MTMQLQNIIDKEELTKDSLSLRKYNGNKKVIKLIDELRSELAETTDDMGELDMLYKFAEILKDRLGGI